MKKISLIIIFTITLILIFTTQSCERDDICPTDSITTPRLFLAFYSIENPEELNPKNVVRFRVQGIGNNETLPNLDGSSNSQEILIPLKTTEGITEYSMHKDYSVDDNGTPDDPSDDIINGNEDIRSVTSFSY